MATAVATQTSVPPNQSLYLQNLPEKLQKHDLQRELYMLFSTYGPILDITALRGSKMRGQAHILMRDVQSAQQAMRACQGFELCGKEMKISYSKNRSNTLSKLTGTFVQQNGVVEKGQGAQAAGGAQAGGGFAAIPGAATGVAPPVPAAVPVPVQMAVDGEKAQAGTKRQREESDDEQEDEMEVEEDDEGAMEMSDDDD